MSNKEKIDAIDVFNRAVGEVSEKGSRDAALITNGIVNIISRAGKVRRGQSVIGGLAEEDSDEEEQQDEGEQKTLKEFNLLLDEANEQIAHIFHEFHGLPRPAALYEGIPLRRRLEAERAVLANVHDMLKRNRGSTYSQFAAAMRRGLMREPEVEYSDSGGVQSRSFSVKASPMLIPVGVSDIAPYIQDPRIWRDAVGSVESAILSNMSRGPTRRRFNLRKVTNLLWPFFLNAYRFDDSIYMKYESLPRRNPDYYLLEHELVQSHDEKLLRDEGYIVAQGDEHSTIVAVHKSIRIRGGVFEELENTVPIVMQATLMMWVLQIAYHARSSRV
ncbi:MAG: hypothetical protein ACE366_03270 [Bradymonadia bacterium]